MSDHPMKLDWVEALQDWLEDQPTRSMPERRSTMQGAAGLVMRAMTSRTSEGPVGVVWLEGSAHR